MYTAAFRRLAGVTQVISPIERYLLHNRLTHTLEVAQVGRRLAEFLLRSTQKSGSQPLTDTLDPDVVEAACLAHDLGHPPFGHVAEQELHQLLLRAGDDNGFNGNAQSFRILTRLASRREAVRGLNLTRGSLCAVLKYPWLRDPADAAQDKWGAYQSESDEFAWARDGNPIASTQPSIEAEIMDWADDIAYAIHDAEDFFCAGIAPLDRLLSDGKARARFVEWAVSDLKANTADAQMHSDAFDSVIRSFPLIEPYRGTNREQGAIHTYSSYYIGQYIESTKAIADASGRWRLRIEPGARWEVTMLKKLTKYYVIDSPSLATLQHGQRSIIRGLFEILCDEARSRRLSRVIPPKYQTELAQSRSDTERARIVTDLISEMTDQQAIEMHRRLTGQIMGSVTDIVHL